MSDFEFNVLKSVGIWKKGCIQKITFWITLLHENNINYNFSAPSQSMILKQEFRDESDWKENVTTCHNLKQTFEIVSEFENKCIRKVAFRIALLHETTFLQVSCLFKKKGVKLGTLRYRSLGEKNLTIHQILKWSSYNCQKLKKRLNS